MKERHLIVTILALALFLWVVGHISVPSIVQQLRAVRIALPIVLALSGLRLLLQSISWAASLKGKDLNVKRSKLAAVRVASQSMGYLTVLGPVVSEPMKIKLLGTSSEATITATLLDDGVYWLTSVLVAGLAVVSLPFVAVHGARYHWLAILVALSLALFAITRRTAMLSGIVRAFGNRAPSWLVRAQELETSLRRYRVDQPALISRIFWIDVGCQVLSASEVVVVLWALHLPIHFLAVFVIEGLTRTFKLMSGWIPARLGSDEAGAISAFALIGFSPMLGLALALTRRFRDLLWAAGEADYADKLLSAMRFEFGGHLEQPKEKSEAA